MATLGHRLKTAVAQWPAIALAWAIHGALVFYLFFAYVPADRVPLGQRLLVGLGIFCLLLAEVALLVVLNAALELLTTPLKPRDPVDALKALLLSLAVGLLAASTLKFSATSVHLKRTDLWFAWVNFRQILEEVTAADAVGFLLVPVGILLLALGLFAGLRRLRTRAEIAGTPRAIVPLALAVPLFALLYASSPGLRLFTDSFVAEVYWTRSALLAQPFFLTAAPAEGGGEGGPPIVAYRPAHGNPRPNVVLVMLESVPWKRTSFGGGPAGATPHLERLAAESVVFSRAYTTSTHSDYAQMAILSSLFPRKYDHHDYYGRIEYPRTLLWDALRAAGYRTTMFSCQNERWGNMLNYLNTPGLEVLRHSLNWPRARHKGRGAESKVYEETPVAEWEAWREAHPDEPFFTYFNFQSNHFPYQIPEEEPRPFTPYRIDFPASYLRYPRDKVPVMLNRFYNALGYADRAIGRIVSFLERRGEWERTLLVVVSDHGEAFYEHGMPTHGTSVLEEQVRSFWLLRAPGLEPRRIDAPVSLLDVAPTVLRLAGLPPHGNFQGRADILDPGYGRTARPLLFTIQGLTFEDGVLLDGWKYIVNWDRRTRRLFDLSTDPDEMENLIELRGDRALALDEVLRGLLTRQLDYYREQGWQQGRYPAPLP